MDEPARCKAARYDAPYGLKISIGPRTPQGKHKAVANAKENLPKEGSRREARWSVADVYSLIGTIADLRKSLEMGAKGP